MHVSLKTLTPLWMGDIDRDSAAAKESGLIGSLRFWYEGILRSYGYSVCDPTDHESECGSCQACDLFGSTGQARKFRLEISGLGTTPVFFKASRGVAVSSGNWLWNIFGGEQTGGRKVRGPRGEVSYQFGTRALWSDAPFDLTVYPRREGRGETLDLLALTLREATRKGAIGAKTQYGFGQVRVISTNHAGAPVSLEDLAEKGRARLERTAPGVSSGDGLFSLHRDRFFSHLYELPGPENMVEVGTPPPRFNGCYIPCAFDIRYKYRSRNPRSGLGSDAGLRPAVRDRFGAGEARRIFGWVRGNEAHASRVHVSHPFREAAGGQYHLKIWGDVDRKDEIEGLVKSHILGRFPASRLLRSE